jgi:hypothetical protein
MSSIVVSGDTSGAITVAAPTTAGTSTLTLPSGASGTIAAQGVSTNIVSGTAVASTSGTSIDFTGIPSWVKRITVMFDGVSTNGTSIVCVQLGDSGGIETTGYSGGATNQSPTYVANTVGYNLMGANIAAASIMGHAVLTNISGNTWVLSAGVQISSSNISAAAGAKTLSATLDRVRITTVNGTDTFDAGSINILYE